MTLKALHFQLDGAEVEQIAAEARAAGYRTGEYARVLLRLGRRHRGELRREEGLHFATPGGSPPRKPRRGGAAAQQAAG